MLRNRREDGTGFTGSASRVFLGAKLAGPENGVTGRKDGHWDVNPWVWAITFKMVKR